jgi:cellulose synthase/poly-beta-1,6-N-acetylglucosamine synthase-like glycosyltransferase
MIYFLHVAGTILYFVVLIGLSAYGIHRYLMIYLYFKHRRENPKPASAFSTLPTVTVQLPLFNEMYVAERLIDACAALDYPREKLEIQVLDDSTDETTAIVTRKVADLRAQGVDVQLIHRPDRSGYKAGALANGLKTVKGEFIAIFDADFVPQPDLLKTVIHYFTDPKIGLLQTRWGHLNETYSLLTRVQSIFLDGHFLIEQTARARSGRFFNFNGTAGIWRRRCIEESGGWHTDTLTEDLDLSYRAQINGWRFLFLPEIVTPAELPIEMNAFKSQQHRWAKGSIQTCKKMLPELWRANVPLKIKLEGTAHLTSNFGYLLLLMLGLLFHPSAATIAAKSSQPWVKGVLVDLPFFIAATLSVTAFYFCAQRQLHSRWWKRLVYLPFLMAVGIGLSLNNARAVLEALFNRRSEFIRTPKCGVLRREQHRNLRTNKYAHMRSLMPFAELAMATYFTYFLAVSIGNGQWPLVPLALLFQLGFLYVGILSLLQMLKPRITAAAPQPQFA